MGNNIILVEAADHIGNSSRISINIEGEKYILPTITRVGSAFQMKALYNKSYAVVIGINQYEKWPALEFAAADAKAIKDTLHNTGFDEITLILDKDATRTTNPDRTLP